MRCCAPFTQMLLRPDGKIVPCCYLYGRTLGDATTTPLKDVWNGARLKKLRREHLKGNSPSCAGRMRNIGCHREFDHWQEQTNWQETQATGPQRLDIRLGGQCNLRCVMCDVWQEPNGRYDESDLFTRGPEELFPELVEVEVAGGEPFIQAEVYRLIKAVYASNQDVAWSFITNGAYRSHRKILKAIDPLKLKRLQISVDSLDPDTYAQIRLGGNLSTVLASVAVFRDYRAQRQDFELVLSQCVRQDNWREIPRFLAYCREQEARPVLQFAYYDPSGQSLSALPAGERQEISQALQSMPVDQNVLAPIIQPLQ